jgi:regulator of nucleoside diphosphate kinase
MKPRTINRWFAAALLVLAASFAWLLRLVHVSTSLRPSVAWLAIVWIAGVVAALLSTGVVSRTARGVGLWMVCVPLATLAHGSAAPVLWALTTALGTFGLASFLNVPLLHTVRAPGALPDIMVTDQDVVRITRVVAGLPHVQRAAAVAAALEGELARARVVPSMQMPGDVVTMNTRLVFEDVDSGVSQEAVLVYPDHEDLRHGRLSVLGPVGSALLGLRVGQSIDWQLPLAELKRYRIVSVLYQPEAAGDFHL